MVQLTIWHQDGTCTIHQAPVGGNLRLFLLEIGHTPYTQITQNLNCGGRGLCATCGVWLLDPGQVVPMHWHDKAADAFGYPRLSCQIELHEDLTICMVDKWIWGHQGTRTADTEQAHKSDY